MNLRPRERGVNNLDSRCATATQATGPEHRLGGGPWVRKHAGELGSGQVLRAESQNHPGMGNSVTCHSNVFASHGEGEVPDRTSGHRCGRRDIRSARRAHCCCSLSTRLSLGGRLVPLPSSVRRSFSDSCSLQPRGQIEISQLTAEACPRTACDNGSPRWAPTNFPQHVVGRRAAKTPLYAGPSRQHSPLGPSIRRWPRTLDDLAQIDNQQTTKLA